MHGLSKSAYDVGYNDGYHYCVMEKSPSMGTEQICRQLDAWDDNDPVKIAIVRAYFLGIHNAELLLGEKLASTN